MNSRGGRSEKASDQAIPVAQYVRMSTDHQRYSTENQRDALQKYADQHGMAVVRTYADEGKSGLSLDGRDALKLLIQDVQAGQPGFEAILVYDVSRWGRFQDADESGYYEYLCRRAGVRVLYCAEPFGDDASPMTVVIKSVKRAMAAEYSRELSTKVFMGQCHLVEMGFHQGGAAGYGLRRLLLDDHRCPKGELRPGDRKCLQTDRVILAPGPANEVAIVRRIYERFVHQRRTEAEIAEELNDIGILNHRGRRWSHGTVHQILTNEKYAGNNVYNRTSCKLQQKRVRNAPDRWVRANGAFEPIVPAEMFAEANSLIAERSRRFDDSAMLEMLRCLYSSHGALSGLLIDEQNDMPSSSVYQYRFGGLLRAYSLIGFQPRRDYRYLEVNRRLRTLLPDIVDDVASGFTAAGGHIRHGTDLLTVNDEFTVSVTIARCLQTPGGACRWHIRFDASLRPDVTVAIRMATDERHVLDYYLFPHIDLPLHPLRLTEANNDIGLDAYRFDSLDFLYALAERVPLQEAA